MNLKVCLFVYFLLLSFDFSGKKFSLDSTIQAGLCEIRPLREKAITWVNSVDIMGPGNLLGGKSEEKGKLIE